MMKEEGSGSISPQYFNDIEHDRRSPSSGHLIRQFSGILNIPEDYLSHSLAAYRMICGRMRPLRTRSSRPSPISERLKE